MDFLISLAAAAQAADPRSPLSYGFWVWAWVIGISAAGGVANFHKKLREGQARPFNLMELVGEVFTSGFVGVLTFLFCKWAAVDELLSYFLCGLTGHMGSRAIFMAERLLESHVENRFK